MRFGEGGDVPWISPKDMKRRVITSAEDYITEDAVDGSATSFVDAGSPLMVVRSGILPSHPPGCHCRQAANAQPRHEGLQSEFAAQSNVLRLLG